MNNAGYSAHAHALPEPPNFTDVRIPCQMNGNKGRICRSARRISLPAGFSGRFPERPRTPEPSRRTVRRVWEGRRAASTGQPQAQGHRTSPVRNPWHVPGHAHGGRRTRVRKTSSRPLRLWTRVIRGHLRGQAGGHQEQANGATVTAFRRRSVFGGRSSARQWKSDAFDSLVEKGGHRAIERRNWFIHRQQLPRTRDRKHSFRPAKVVEGGTHSRRVDGAQRAGAASQD